MSFIRSLSVLAVSGALALPIAAGAQTTTASPAPAASTAPMMDGHHGRHHHQSLMYALRSLDLTDAQKQQVATFHSQEQQANQNADAATKRANAAKMRDQIMGILTADQKTQLAAHMQHGHGHHDSAMPTPSSMPSPPAQ